MCTKDRYIEKPLKKKEMIDFINHHLSDKTLKLGCVVRSKTHWIVTITEIFDVCSDDIIEYKIWDPFPHWEMLFMRYKTYSWDVSLDNIIEVIWSPVTLEDVLFMMNGTYKQYWSEIRSKLLHNIFSRTESLLLNRKLRTPLKKQSTTCIKLIYHIMLSLWNSIW